MQTDKLIQKAEDAIRKNNEDYAIQFLEQVFKLEPNHAMAVDLYFEAVDSKWRGKNPPKPKTCDSVAVDLETLGRWGLRSNTLP